MEWVIRERNGYPLARRSLASPISEKAAWILNMSNVHVAATFLGALYACMAWVTGSVMSV